MATGHLEHELEFDAAAAASNLRFTMMMAEENNVGSMIFMRLSAHLQAKRNNALGNRLFIRFVKVHPRTLLS